MRSRIRPGELRRSRQATEISGLQPCRGGAEPGRPSRLSEAHPEEIRICGLQETAKCLEGRRRLQANCNAFGVPERVNGYAQSRCRDLAAAPSPWFRRKSLWTFLFPCRSTSEWGIGAANARSANWATEIPALSTASHTPPSRACFAKANSLREKTRAKAKTLDATSFTYRI
jgi:hypothetical protein